MKKENLSKAAEILARTEWSQLAGKRCTAENIESDINAIFGSRGQIKKAANSLYRGAFKEAGKLTGYHSLEEILSGLLNDYYDGLSAIQRGEQWISAYVLGTLSIAKASIDFVESRVG